MAEKQTAARAALRSAIWSHQAGLRARERVSPADRLPAPDIGAVALSIRLDSLTVAGAASA